MKTRGNCMKTTNDSKSTLKDDSTKTVPSLKLQGMTSFPGKSVRPQRSMMRVQSLKPKRLSTVSKKASR